MAAKSRNRRCGVVYNKDHQRPSSSQSRSSRPSHFFKIILPSSMHDMKLRLPAKFAREFGDELSTVAVLTAPNGCIWQVGLEKAEKKIWFRDGWQDFVKYHSIQHGYFLVLNYEGNSNFHVLVFDMTATEIQYPSNGDKTRTTNPKLEDQIDIMESDNVKESTQHNLNANEMSTAHEFFAKPEEDREIFVRRTVSDMPSTRRLAMSRVREREIQAATIFKTRHPYFIRTLRPYNLTNSFVSLSTGFAKKYISGKKSVKLQGSDGKQWHCLCRRTNGTNSPSRIGKGWTKFCRANHFNEGDICVFELIKRSNVVLKVSILPSS